MITREQLEASESSARKKGFDDFMAKPTTRLLLSMIPAAEHRDMLTALLAEAFDAGFAGGGGSMMATVLEQVMKGRSGPGRE